MILIHGILRPRPLVHSSLLVLTTPPHPCGQSRQWGGREGGAHRRRRDSFPLRRTRLAKVARYLSRAAVIVIHSSTLSPNQMNMGGSRSCSARHSPTLCTEYPMISSRPQIHSIYTQLPKSVPSSLAARVRVSLMAWRLKSRHTPCRPQEAPRANLFPLLAINPSHPSTIQPSSHSGSPVRHRLGSPRADLAPRTQGPRTKSPEPTSPPTHQPTSHKSTYHPHALATTPTHTHSPPLYIYAYARTHTTTRHIVHTINLHHHPLLRRGAIARRSSYPDYPCCAYAVRWTAPWRARADTYYCTVVRYTLLSRTLQQEHQEHSFCSPPFPVSIVNRTFSISCTGYAYGTQSAQAGCLSAYPSVTLPLGHVSNWPIGKWTRRTAIHTHTHTHT